MALNVLGVPRVSGSSDEVVPILLNWMTDFYRAVVAVEARLTTAEAANTTLDARLTTLQADVTALGALTQTISNPPTQAEVTAIQTKVNALIAAFEPPES